MTGIIRPTLSRISPATLMPAPRAATTSPAALSTAPPPTTSGRSSLQGSPATRPGMEVPGEQTRNGWRPLLAGICTGQHLDLRADRGMQLRRPQGDTRGADAGFAATEHD